MGDIHSQIVQFLPIFLVLVVSIAVHEFAHCWTTDRLGDDTPRLLGRVTLNPLKHLDPMGTIMMVVSSLSGFGIGWGKASPFNPDNFRNPERDRMLTGIAGPISNVLQLIAWASIGLIVSSIAQFFPVSNIDFVQGLCATGMVVNAALAVFNMIPIFPLDGHHVLSYLVPRAWKPIVDDPRWGLLFLVLVLYRPLWDSVVTPVFKPALKFLVNTTAQLVGWPHFEGMGY